MQDDLVTDCEILVKGSSNVPSPPPPVAARSPESPITELALQMQKAGDVLNERFAGRVDVRLFCEQ